MRQDKKIYALGFFDGVHRGHQVLLHHCRELAKETGCATAAITFDRHPKSLFTQTPTVLISAVPDRELLLHRYGMDHVRVLPVTKETMGLPWRAFVDLLLEDGAAGFVCGDDFRFGCRGEGNAEKLQQLCQELGLPCVIVPEQQVSSIRISSTYIRRQLETGDMATAVAFLGHPYTLTGNVVRGPVMNDKLGIPTASLRFPKGLTVPRFGVYACRALVDGKAYIAVTNIGCYLGQEDETVHVVAWIQDYAGDLCGKELTLEFYKFLRPEQNFPDLESLTKEIWENARQTRDLIQI